MNNEKPSGNCPLPQSSLGRVSGDPRFAPWEVLDSEELLDASPWLKVTSERVRLPDGRVVEDYHRIDMSDFSAMYARTHDGRVVVLRQYLHGVRDICLTLPAGRLEIGEPPIEGAKRELLEETGYDCARWRSLGKFAVSGSQGGGWGNFFIGEDANRVAEPESGDLEVTDVILMTEPELVSAMAAGEFKTLNNAALVAMGVNLALLGKPIDNGG
jgi:ADP-ribose pyrophosphatase